MVTEALDWADLANRLTRGDRVAFVELSRLAAGTLQRLRAWDFESEWPDLIQEVMMGIIAASRAGKLRDSKEVAGYVRQITSHKFHDRLRRRYRRHEGDTLPWNDVNEDRLEISAGPRHDEMISLRKALHGLSEKQRRVVVEVYAAGKTYEQVAEETGIPLGSLKRYLREGLEELRRRLEGGGHAE